LPETATFIVLLATEDEALPGKLESPGLNITTVRDGFEAINHAIRTHPDAIVLDNSLPGLPGPTLALWLKLNPLTASIPVIGLEPDSSGTWRDSQIDISISISQAPLVIGQVIRELRAALPSESVQPNHASSTPVDPLEVTLDLIDVYRERLKLSNSIMEIATIQRDLSDFEHTIRMVLDTAARALRSRLLSLTIVQDKVQYVLVTSTGLNVAHLKALEDETNRIIVGCLGSSFTVEQQLVFGRRRLSTDPLETTEYGHFFGHPIKCKGQVLGYLSGLHPANQKDSTRLNSMLQDLASRTALILNNAELLREHERHLGELASILRAALETSSISPLSGIQTSNPLLQYLLIVLELCKTPRGCLVLFDENTGLIADSAALGCDAKEILSEPFRDCPSVAEYIQSLSPDEVILDQESNFSGTAGRLLVSLAVGEKIMGGLVILGTSNSINFRIIQAVKTLAGMGGYFVYNSALYKEKVKSSIIEDQLNLAREIQRDMIPNWHPDMPGYDIFGRSEPARQVGGDFFDYLQREDGRLQIAIADVSGKGIPASLLMTMTRALVIATSENNCGPEKILCDVNQHLVKRISSGQFVTASLLSLSPDGNTYGSAGHSPIFIYRAAGGKFDEITADGVAMGIVDTIDFERVEIKLDPGDIGIMFTDGLNEAMNSRREQFGYERIREVVRSHAQDSSEDIVDALFQAIEDHAAGSDQFDDTTVVAVKKL
jgi:CheY-like chemotaxis protein